jgi:adenosylcobinamide-phosphate synthase
MITTNLIVALLAYLIDRIFGEFTFIKHPIILIGDVITFLEQKLYKDSIFRGALLVILTLLFVGAISFAFTTYLSYLNHAIATLITAFLASIFLAHKMLFDSVATIVDAPNKKELISMLVSRDTQNLSESEIYKAAIETYAENLSDGVIAPLFYLILFGLPGIIIYKTINTMDSMIGYRNEKYEKFGKVAARLDDFVNYIPARITAILIMLLTKSKNIFAFYKDGSKHESPNAGHPISAMAYTLGIKLGGPTSYFGVIHQKAFFGEGREEIYKEDLQKMLAKRRSIDIAIVSCLLLFVIIAKLTS